MVLYALTTVHIYLQCNYPLVDSLRVFLRRHGVNDMMHLRLQKVKKACFTVNRIFQMVSMHYLIPDDWIVN